MTVSAKIGNVSFETKASSAPVVTSADAESKREHDFGNWLQVLVFAAEGADPEMVAAVAEELRQMYRTANRKA